MKRELGIVRCGLACCLCTETPDCDGCGSNGFPDNDSCENKKCSIAKGLTHCYECEEDCRKQNWKIKLSKRKRKILRYIKAGKKALLLQKGYCLEILMLIR
mgnify:CR=1 FL=1